MRVDGLTMKARSPAHVALAPEAIPLTWANLQAVSFEAALLFLPNLHHWSQGSNGNGHLEAQFQSQGEPPSAETPPLTDTDAE